jgi:membrane protein implicated in regulation of membrane protease activity
MAPGAFMLWFGFAAAGMAMVLLLPGIDGLCRRSCSRCSRWFRSASTLKWFRRRAPGSDQPLLNRRADQLIGQVVRLDQAIVAGRGRVQIADAFWTVEGPTSRRAPVRVVAVDGMLLKVQVPERAAHGAAAWLN